HEGEAVAMVIARTPQAARRSAGRLVVRYRPFPATSDCLSALEPDAPAVWDEVPGNLCFDWELGDESGTHAAFARAAHVVEATIRNNRIVVSPLETRNAIGFHDQASDRRWLVSATQGPHWTRKIVA